jgi:hypothetical protein
MTGCYLVGHAHNVCSEPINPQRANIAQNVLRMHLPNGLSARLHDEILITRHASAQAYFAMPRECWAAVDGDVEW